MQDNVNPEMTAPMTAGMYVPCLCDCTVARHWFHPSLVVACPSMVYLRAATHNMSSLLGALEPVHGTYLLQNLQDLSDHPTSLRLQFVQSFIRITGERMIPNNAAFPGLVASALNSIEALERGFPLADWATLLYSGLAPDSQDNAQDTVQDNAQDTAQDNALEHEHILDPNAANDAVSAVTFRTTTATDSSTDSSMASGNASLGGDAA
jgi:hypothetical protein